MKNRGLYGSSDGSERISNEQAALNRQADNELIEGKWVSLLHSYIKSFDWFMVKKTCQDMRDEGFSQARIDVIVRQATCGVRLK